MSEVLLTPKQLGERYDKTQAALAQWRWRGIGPPFLKIGGGAVRYRLSDVEAYEAAALQLHSAG